MYPVTQGVGLSIKTREMSFIAGDYEKVEMEAEIVLQLKHKTGLFFAVLLNIFYPKGSLM